MISHEFAVADPPAVEVDARTASIVLERGPAGAVSVHIDTKHPDDWVVSRHGDSISVRDDGGGWRLRGGSARVRIAVPDGTAAVLTTGSGDVSVLVSTGRTAVTTASGDVRVGIAAALTVKTASGDVTIDRVAGDVNVKSASGDVQAASVGGELHSSSASGDVRVEQLHGDARIATASGDIRVARFEGGSFSANTVSGDVWLGVPSGRSVDLDVKTLSGDVRLPERRSGATEATRSRVSVRVKSVSGDFRLERA